MGAGGHQHESSFTPLRLPSKTPLLCYRRDIANRIDTYLTDGVTFYSGTKLDDLSILDYKEIVEKEALHSHRYHHCAEFRHCVRQLATRGDLYKTLISLLNCAFRQSLGESQAIKRAQKFFKESTRKRMAIALKFVKHDIKNASNVKNYVTEGDIFSETEWLEWTEKHLQTVCQRMRPVHDGICSHLSHLVWSYADPLIQPVHTVWIRR